MTGRRSRLLPRVPINLKINVVKFIKNKKNFTIFFHPANRHFVWKLHSITSHSSLFPALKGSTHYLYSNHIGITYNLWQAPALTTICNRWVGQLLIFLCIYYSIPYTKLSGINIPYWVYHLYKNICIKTCGFAYRSQLRLAFPCIGSSRWHTATVFQGLYLMTAL